MELMQKRKHPRVNISFPVECDALPQNDYFYTVSKDLSLGGAKIINSCFLPKGSLVKLHINLIDKVLSFKAKVAWCNQARSSERHLIGLEFVEADSSHQKNLTRFLGKICPV